MSRTPRMTTGAVAALAAVLGVGMVTAPVGATTALWQDQVRLPGVTVVAAPTPDEPPIDIEPEKPLDPIELPPGYEHALGFYYDIRLDLSRYELPIILRLEHGWSAVSGSATQFQGHQTEYWVVQEDGSRTHHLFQDQTFSALDPARTEHLFYREGGSRPDGYAETALPAGATSITVRLKAHAVHYDYAPTASFRLSGGSGVASFYPASTTAEPLVQVPYTLPDLYWDAAAPDGARATVAEQPAPDPTTDGVATTRDEDLEASP
ncbi:MAG: hypothetical protein IR158_10985 [Cellulomonas sp.]|uniref:hypothetical protein n=1 Tax=Cellulomonas sp. TaxID=40001 RepID=UPI001A05E93A|nr:hypothetical protein [Cellulomonas sp.]MBF0688270.1 hypothetical protein [Cellulomonas sp.]